MPQEYSDESKQNEKPSLHAATENLVDAPVRIPLTKGKFAIVDKDCEHLANFKWFCDPYGSGYAGRNVIRFDGKRRTMYLHHAVVGFPLHGLEIDHINGDGLDNRKQNLRIANRRQNRQNHKARRMGLTTSKYVGVSWCKRNSKWAVYAGIGKKNKNLGLFSKEEDASNAYQEFISKIQNRGS